MNEFWQGFLTGIAAWTVVIVSSNLTLFYILSNFNLTDKDR